MARITPEAAVAALAFLTTVVTYVRGSAREKAVRRAELVHSYSSEFSGNQSLVDLFTDLDYRRFRFVEDEDTWLGCNCSGG